MIASINHAPIPVLADLIAQRINTNSLKKDNRFDPTSPKRRDVPPAHFYAGATFICVYLCASVVNFFKNSSVA